MEDFDAHFFVTVEESVYQVIPSDGESFLILLNGVKIGGIWKDEHKRWQWTDSYLTQDFADAIGHEIDTGKDKTG